MRCAKAFRRQCRSGMKQRRKVFTGAAAPFAGAPAVGTSARRSIARDRRGEASGRGVRGVKFCRQ